VSFTLLSGVDELFITCIDHHRVCVCVCQCVLNQRMQNKDVVLRAAAVKRLVIGSVIGVISIVVISVVVVSSVVFCY